MTGADSSLRYLSRADIESLGIPPRDVIDILDGAFAEKAAGLVEMPSKIGVHTRKDAFIHAMPAYLGGIDAVGLKWVAGYPTNAAKGVPYLHGLAILSDAETGRPLCVMDATWITEVRTAAASVLGIRYLLDRPPETLAVVGCGRQGRVHLELLEDVFPGLRSVYLHDPNPAATAELIASHPAGASKRGARSVAEAVTEAELVVTAAPIVRDPRPEVKLGGIASGCVICAIDFDASVDPEIAQAADTFVVDDLAQYRHYRELGHFGGYPESPVELVDVAASPEAHAGDLAVYVPLGLALEDVALAARIFERARDAAIGERLAL